MQLKFFILIGIGLGLVAGIMAYLITYEEYQHHFKGKRVHIESIKSAFVTFIFFIVLSVAIGYVMSHP